MKDTGLILIDYYLQLIDAGFTTDEAYDRMFDMFQRIKNADGYTKLDIETMLNDGSWQAIFDRINRMFKGNRL